MKRFLVNLGAILVLALLLAAPGVFSNNLTQFTGETFGFEVVNNSDKFAQLLKLERAGGGGLGEFNLEFTTFENKAALYRAILEIENKTNLPKKVKVANSNQKIAIFFDTGLQTQGSSELQILPKQKVGISLLVPANTQIKTASFSLESD